MRTFAAFLILAAGPGIVAAQATKEDLVKLARADISENVILAYLKANGFQGHLSTDDLVELKAAGVGDRVLEAVMTPGSEAPAAPAEAPSTEPDPELPWPYGSGSDSVVPDSSTYDIYTTSYSYTYYPYYSGFCWPTSYYSYGFGFSYAWPYSSFCSPYYGFYRPFFSDCGSFFRAGRTRSSGSGSGSGSLVTRLRQSATGSRTVLRSGTRVNRTSEPVIRRSDSILDFRTGLRRPATGSTFRESSARDRGTFRPTSRTSRENYFRSSGRRPESRPSGSSFRSSGRSSARPSGGSSFRSSSSGRSRGSSFSGSRGAGRSSSSGSRSGGSRGSRGRR